VRPPAGRTGHGLRRWPAIAIVLVLAAAGLLLGRHVHGGPTAAAGAPAAGPAAAAAGHRGPATTTGTGPTGPTGTGPTAIGPAGVAAGNGPGAGGPGAGGGTGPGATGPAAVATGNGSGAGGAGTSGAGSAGRAPAGTRPVGLRIPTIGVAVPLSTLGLNPDRTVEVPTDFARAGWFGLGPAPGQPGSAVLLGHVDSYRGPAVFFRLGTLRPGDRVEVTRADGAVARFAVRAVRTYLKRDFPARQVYGTHGGRSLQLVTCGGEFDRAARSYLSNVVVYTELVAIVPPAGR
jgi:hypothetical protein